jgi:HK97 family phage portal protein
MSFLNTLASAFLDGLKAPDQAVAVRHSSEFPAFEEQMSQIWARGRGEVWRTSSVDEALTSPAIFAGVALITNTVATLSMEAFRKGKRLPQENAPRLILRPDPFRTLRSFLQTSAFYLVTRGELPWYVAKRDPLDDSAMSIVAVPPWELTRDDGSSRLRPIWRWGDTVLRNEDLKIIQYLPGRDGRGFGPLQKCGAAVSIAVESEQWAANFFNGSLPSIIGTTDQDMTGPELDDLSKQWLEKPPNQPRWLTNGLTISESPFSPEKAQLRDVRDANVGDAARMFSIPGALLEYQMSGSSLTYRNDETIWTDFQRRCLSPHYLEPMEQEMSDLLTRSTVARFNLDQLLRASAKERAEINSINIASGIYDAEYAARREGITPGAVDFAPVPLALPQAVPTRLPVDGVVGPTSSTPPLTLAALGAGRSSMADLKCYRCGKLAGRVAGAAEIKCSRCGAIVTAA